MKEVEVKILEINLDNILNILEKEWAKKIFDWEIRNEFYIDSNGNRLRLRRAWIENIMTYKYRLNESGVKSQMEYEVKFDEYDNMVKILEWIGYIFIRKSNKHRMSFALGNIHFDIDKLEWIPTFLEVESDNSEDVIRWVEMLWYKMEETSLLTETGILEKYSIHSI
jgi:predicted adenylyl cyclase CyaB